MDNEFYSSDLNYEENELKSLCFHCFEVLVNKLEKKSVEVPFPHKFANVKTFYS